MDYPAYDLVRTLPVEDLSLETGKTHLHLLLPVREGERKGGREGDRWIDGGREGGREGNINDVHLWFVKLVLKNVF